jgi:16S rRNA C1402 (ribose-2'-O) methylase RsmI
VVFFEAPHRIGATLAEARSACGKRPIFVNREITKVNEQLVEYTNTTDGLALTIPERGEFSVIVGQDSNQSRQAHADLEVVDIGALFDHITKTTSIDTNDAISGLSVMVGVPRFKLANLLKKAAIAAKRSKED